MEQAVIKPQQQKIPHNLILENRRELLATGILAIVSYDEYAATLETSIGTLVVGGEHIKVSELSTQSGELKIHGEIEYVQYTAKKEKQESFLKRLMR